ncbi:phenol 2-monooxygenase [Tomitella fengzijianii]|uniref:propane 2-monooxygenase n=1 Tax=Tomitella fengzijianii TaxID=2597660 RepID=A0A516X576_9ACTN|nr:phenol 2-monooxygenase [Tomitella fengzijianii]QDQ98215.1 phenol 2-monooxygenase [Tomitella fengzijianii]
MQYELRTQVIEPRRHTFQNVIDRRGDEPASRYLEGTLDIEPRNVYHYRPTWTAEHELYDPNFTQLLLTDPYSFLDPRQYYYTPYVTNRAAHHDEFGKSLAYIEQRGLLAKMPEGWRSIVGSAVVPLRHYESGGQLVSVAGSRFAYGTSIEQCCSYASFDRIGNAQMLSRVGIALADGTSDMLQSAKIEWIEGAHLQPLRKLTEQIMVCDDWAESLLALDVTDSLLYEVVFRGLDEAALTTGGGAYSLVAQYFTAWFADQRRWLDALVKSWCTDDGHGAQNRQTLESILDRWRGRALEAVMPIAAFIDAQVDGVFAKDLLGDTHAHETDVWNTKLGAQA